MSTLAPALFTARVERDIVKAFRGRRAISGATAAKLRELGLKDTPVFRHLITATIVRKAGPDRFFLHEPTWAARSNVSWRTMGIAAGVLITVVVTLLLLR